MTGFSSKQTRALRRKLDRRYVHSREANGRSLDYIEGWFAISEANAIFGFDGWDREMTHFERLYERSRESQTSCGYLARVRIRVRTGDATIVREGTGWGSATSLVPGEAHERALKAAETDATKRALATFGNRFGLALYDKEQGGVTAKRTAKFTIFDPKGAVFADDLSAEAFCTGLRQLIEAADAEELPGLDVHNKSAIDRLRTDRPNLKTEKGIHYAEILTRLIASQRQKLAARASSNSQMAIGVPALPPSRIAPGPRIDKSVLRIGTERRFRDKAHLQFVASQPCLVCGRKPSHAHHLKFAQKRGLSIKVSDEFTVPLCAIHHDELHRSADEAAWWRIRDVEPMTIASGLWTRSRTRPEVSESRVNGSIAAAPERSLTSEAPQNPI